MGLFDFFRGETTPTPPPKKSKRAAGGMKVVFRGHGAKAGMPEAGDTDHTTAGWTTHPISILSITEQRWSILCARGREAAYNTDHGKQFLRLVRKNVAGPQGIVVVPTVLGADGEADNLARAAIREAWERWCREPDVTGVHTFISLQSMCVQNVAKDGEVFIRRLRGRKYGPCHYQLQIIDPARVPVHYREKLSNGNRVKCGIEFTAAGKPVAYYVRADLDDYLVAMEYSGEKYERVPAEEMFHLFVPEAINQPRGFSWMGTALTRLHHLSKYETAAVINARLGASKMGFFKADPEAMDEPGEDDEDAEVDFPLDADPGTFERMPYGYSFDAGWNPQYPQGEFDGFVKAVLHSIAAGLGVSYSSLSGDLSGANYSSIRAGMLEERDEWTLLQGWFIDKLVRPVFEEWVSLAVLAGAITIGLTPLRVERVAQYKRARFQGRRWAWVDPSKDIKAQRDAHDGRIKSISDTIRDAGGDPDQTFEEIAEERRRLSELGILPAPAKAAPAKEENESAEGKTED